MKEPKSIVVVSGYFDPIHVGHLEYFNQAQDYKFDSEDSEVDKFIIIVNNDKQLKLKKGTPFMPEFERLTILANIKTEAYDSEVVLALDDDSSVCRTLEYIRATNPYDNIVFGNGGDRKIQEVPEKATCDRLNINMVDGLGKKIQSSSALIAGSKDGA